MSPLQAFWLAFSRGDTLACEQAYSIALQYSQSSPPVYQLELSFAGAVLSGLRGELEKALDKLSELLLSLPLQYRVQLWAAFKQFYVQQLQLLEANRSYRPAAKIAFIRKFIHCFEAMPDPAASLTTYEALGDAERSIGSPANMTAAMDAYSRALSILTLPEMCAWEHSLHFSCSLHNRIAMCEMALRRSSAAIERLERCRKLLLEAARRPEVAPSAFPLSTPMPWQGAGGGAVARRTSGGQKMCKHTCAMGNGLLATALGQAGDLRTAIERQQEAIELFLEIDGQHLMLLMAYVSMGEMYVDAGELAQAQQAVRNAEELLQRLRLHPNVATRLTPEQEVMPLLLMALVYLAVPEYERAREKLYEARRLAAVCHASDVKATANHISHFLRFNMAMSTGQYSDASLELRCIGHAAERLLLEDKDLSEAERTELGNRSLLLKIATRVAVSAAALGFAVSPLIERLEMCRDLDGAMRSDLEVAKLMLQVGDAERDAQYLAVAEKLAALASSPLSPSAALLVLYLQIFVHSRLGQFARVLELTAPDQPQQRKALSPNPLAEIQRGLFRALAQVHHKEYSAAEKELVLCLETKLEALRVTATRDPMERVQLLDNAAFGYNLLQACLLRCASPRSTLALSVSDASKARALLDKFAGGHKAAAAFGVIDPNFEAVARAAAKKHNATLVSYNFFHTVRSWNIPAEIWIWVIPPNDDTPITYCAVPLKDSEEFVQKVSSLHACVGGVGLERGEHRGDEEDDELPRRPPNGLFFRDPVIPGQGQGNNRQRAHDLLSELYQVLIAPIQAYLPTAENKPVIIIPHFILFLVPFSALVDSTGQYLIQKHTLAFAPSIRYLAMSDPAKPPRALKSALIISDPEHPPELCYPHLPGTREEAALIKCVFTQRQLAQPSVLTAAEATKAALNERVKHAAIIHAACHGILDGVGIYDRQFPGALVLAKDPVEQNYLCTSEDIENMSVHAGGLVVLTACNSARGRLSGEGVIGLWRAFLAAGASRVIGSLWRVPDAPTAPMMRVFYEALLSEQHTVAECLRMAILSSIEAKNEVATWGSFLLVGWP